jgi:hypothetical protein
LAQIGRSLPDTLGVALYSMANPATDGNFTQFASALASGPFADRPLTPALPWKAVPRKGHLMGIARSLDSAPVTIRNVDTGAQRAAATDGGGFFGAVDLDPGVYDVRAGAGGLFYAGRVIVEAGRVATVRLRPFGLRRSSGEL